MPRGPTVAGAERADAVGPATPDTAHHIDADAYRRTFAAGCPGRADRRILTAERARASTRR
jgi:hypothetical protein